MAISLYSSWEKVVRLYTFEGRKDTSSVFDYFSDTPSIGDTIYFSDAFLFVKDIKLFVGTTIDGSPVFAWEYFDGSSWVALQVHNGDALTKAGEQIVTFTPPRGIKNQRSANVWPAQAPNDVYYFIRVRLTDVTDVTEGGAQSTQTVLANRFGLELTGAETFSSLYTADLAGTYEILPATISAVGIISAKPTTSFYDYLADRIQVTLSGTTAGAGDTVDINGTLGDGTVVTDTIDVSAGDGAYTSSIDFHDVTSIDCNGFADGTISAASNRWGVIYKPYDQCYVFGGEFFVGDGTIATTLTGTDDVINLARGHYFHVKNNATLNLDGSVVRFPFSSNETVGWMASGGAITASDSQLIFDTDSTSKTRMNVYGGESLTLTDCILHGGGAARSTEIYIYANPTVSFTRVSFTGDTILTFWNLTTNDFSFTDFSQEYVGAVWILTGGAAYYFVRMNVPSVKIYNLNGGTYYFDDCEITTWYWQGTPNGDSYSRKSFDLKVVDNNGDGIDGATVTIDDADDTEVFSGATDGSGDITQQWLVYQLNASGTISWANKTPHTVTISKAGYAPRTIKYTMDREREEIEKLSTVRMNPDLETMFA